VTKDAWRRPKPSGETDNCVTIECHGVVSSVSVENSFRTWIGLVRASVEVSWRLRGSIAHPGALALHTTSVGLDLLTTASKR
jgi:hypothetical protein